MGFGRRVDVAFDDALVSARQRYGCLTTQTGAHDNLMQFSFRRFESQLIERFARTKREPACHQERRTYPTPCSSRK